MEKELGKKVLVIDDDADVLEMVSYNLNRAGYRVVTAPSGINAVWGLEEDSRPDVILLDLMMPTLDGYDMCRYLKSSDEFRHIPLIIISAKGTREDVAKGLALGADAYLPKGTFTMQGLLEEIKRVA